MYTTQVLLGSFIFLENPFYLTIAGVRANALLLREAAGGDVNSH